MISNLLAIDSSLRTFLNQLTDSIGFGGFLGIVIGVELLFVLLFAIKSVFSYESRLKRKLDKCNNWLFTNKKLTTDNIKSFNDIVKKGPKRFAYYWQQFILNREGGPAAYMTEENIIEKPLKTSSWNNNARNLGILTVLWAVVSALFGLTSQSGEPFSFQGIAVSLILPAIVALIGTVALVVIRGFRVLNLDDIYHLYHIFARFVTNACDELPPYIDFNLLFSPKEIENGNPQIRQYYEEMARKAKEEFEEAQKSEQNSIDYNFRGVGVDGALLLERAMKESEMYISTKSATLSQIAQVEAQKEALKRNFENIQMDLQRKIQASKENIAKLIEQQATTTNRFDVGRLRERQDKEVKRQEQLQGDYDQEEARYLTSKDELDKEIERLSRILVESLDKAEKGMTAEYQSFFKKVMKSAYSVADNKVRQEKKTLTEERDKTEQELINVQTQIKRLLDENVTLRARLDELNGKGETSEENSGRYDEQGNFIYSDGSYHDTKGLFHDVDGKVYDMNGVLLSEKKDEDNIEQREEELLNEQEESFGTVMNLDENETLSAATAETVAKDVEPKVEENEVQTQEPLKEEPSQDELEEGDDEEEPKRKRPVSRVKKNAKKPESTEKRGRGRPRKNPKPEEELDEISKMISDEESKLDNLKAQLEDAVSGGTDVEKQKQDLLASIEAIKTQADKMKAEDSSSEELAKINARIEELINKLSSLNS